MNISDLVAELASARAEEQALDAQIKEGGARAPLAERLHSRMCWYNHTDQCAWGYEGGNWGHPEHSRWLNKTERLVDKYGEATINSVLDALEEVLFLADSR